MSKAWLIIFLMTSIFAQGRIEVEDALVVSSTVAEIESALKKAVSQTTFPKDSGVYEYEKIVGDHYAPIERPDFSYLISSTVTDYKVIACRSEKLKKNSNRKEATLTFESRMIQEEEVFKVLSIYFNFFETNGVKVLQEIELQISIFDLNDENGALNAYVKEGKYFGLLSDVKMTSSHITITYKLKTGGERRFSIARDNFLDVTLFKKEDISSKWVLLSKFTN